MLVRGVEADVLPSCERHRVGVISWSPLASGWLSGQYRKGVKKAGSDRAERIPHIFKPNRYDLSSPTNRAKLEAASALADLADEIGLSLVHLALAFVIGHPAVTSAIIGPRTYEHFQGQIGAIDVTLPHDVLDRIDEIVPPGQNFDAADAGYIPPSLSDRTTRRR
jgi:aryl-alcohol dehydrogenase-like predicted oxidoreductase